VQNLVNTGAALGPGRTEAVDAISNANRALFYASKDLLGTSDTGIEVAGTSGNLNGPRDHLGPGQRVDAPLIGKSTESTSAEQREHQGKNHSPHAE